MSNPNIRRKGETQMQFRKRRGIDRIVEKQESKGRRIWDSSVRGTYVHVDGLKAYK